MFKKVIVLSLFGLLIQSCQSLDIVIAQSAGGLIFEIKKNWDYAAKVTPPGMIQQVLKENIDSWWVGDPNRFSVIKMSAIGQKTLYFINPSIDCPLDKECNSVESMELHFPLCGATGGCSYIAYIEENGQYRKVFNKLIWRQGGDDFLKVSNQLKDGVPACLELIGFDYESKVRGLPPHEDNQRFVSQYCYNGNQYVLTRLYLVSKVRQQQ